MRRRGIQVGFAVVVLAVYVTVLTRGGVIGSASAAADALASIAETRSSAAAPGAVLFEERFNRPDGLITNEYAYWNPRRSETVASPDWRVTSGSFFVRSGTGWTGPPDSVTPDATSDNGTDSAVFRLTTQRFDFGDVAVAFALRTNGLVETPRTQAHGWDGVHVFLRYHSPSELYYVSVDRRDGRAVIKKKCPRGAVNGGTYFPLGRYVSASFPLRRWTDVRATATNGTHDAVTISLSIGGRLVLTRTDRGAGCAAITTRGAVGLRGDNANFQIDDFAVSSLG
jgi:hypothetical protein